MARPEYVIINDTDGPTASMVCQWVPSVGYCYLDRSGTKPRHDGMKGAEATDVQDFGWVYTNNKDGTVSFYLTKQPSTATYRDGAHRRWQSPEIGFERKRVTAAMVLRREKTPPMPDPLPALRAATEGSRELDALVAQAVGWLRRHVNALPEDDVWEDSQGWKYPGLPHFTTSVDAALTLVPEGMEIVLGCIQGKRWGAARIFSRDELAQPTGLADDANSLPIAICIAALSARAGGEG